MHKTYLVGGAVRDKLLGKVPNDLDYVVVGATSQEMLDAGFENVGESFPVFLHPVTRDEYALARQERKTGAGHTAFAVEFDPSITIELDLMRRDLTINSIAEDEDGNLVDPFNGHSDLKHRILRHTSPAFAEDPLRVVRLARFAARFSDFTIAPATIDLARMIVKSGEMETLSEERYWAEIEKVFENPKHALRFFEVLYQFGAMDKVGFFDKFYSSAAIWYASGLETDKIADEDKLTAFVALATVPQAFEPCSKTKSAYVDAHRNLNLVWRNRNLYINNFHVEFNADQIFTVLKRIRGFDGKSSALKTLLMVMNYGEHCGIRFGVTSEKLAKAAAAGQTVTAEAFLNLPGKEIGVQMDKLRTVRIAEALFAS
jgi:tRNA nucleotidyltransferase/poly(A) polymerase